MNLDLDECATLVPNGTGDRKTVFVENRDANVQTKARPFLLLIRLARVRLGILNESRLRHPTPVVQNTQVIIIHHRHIIIITVIIIIIIIIIIAIIIIITARSIILY